MQPLSYHRDQQFFFSLEGSAFVAVNPPDQQFFRATLPTNLFGPYFLGFLLALHQRTALIGLSTRIVREWIDQKQDVRRRLKTLMEITEQLLDFTANWFFAQLLVKTNQQAVYAKWREVMAVPDLYAEVRHEVGDMLDYTELEARELQLRDDQERAVRQGRNDRLLTAIIAGGTFFVVITAVFAYPWFVAEISASHLEGWVPLGVGVAIGIATALTVMVIGGWRPRFAGGPSTTQRDKTS